MLSEKKLLDIAFSSDLSVLLQGETGTGKSLLACRLHHEGLRKNGPWVHIDLSGLHEHLMESELFGHEKGAFTGATQKKRGRLLLADGGTLFLDEIGELPLPLQAKLLDFLQHQRVTPVGSLHSIRVNTRVIAATHQNLQEQCEKGLFRKDLFYRLRVLEIHLKPLREEKSQLKACLDSWKQEIPFLKLEPTLEHELLTHPWPGNWRELEHLKLYFQAAFPNSTLSLDCLPSWFHPQSTTKSHNHFPQTLTYQKAFENFEQKYLEALSLKSSGKKSWMAQEAGISRSMLFRKLKKYNL